MTSQAFTIENQELYCEDVPLAHIAEQFGTPTYVYSAAYIRRRYQNLVTAFEGLDTTICYAVKANSNQAVITLLGKDGAGADVVSIGEYRRARRAGIATDKIVFAGVGKTKTEMAEALDGGLLQFNVESVGELRALNDVALAAGKVAPIALRLNPDVDAKTHAKITTGKAENKFGISIDDALALAPTLHDMGGLRLESLAMHIGSQLTDLEPYRAAYGKLADAARAFQAAGHDLKRIDAGGGLGVTYSDEAEPDLAGYRQILDDTLVPLGLPLVFEPGRYLVAGGGGLLTRVIYHKEGEKKRFIIADAAMNDLIRPTLYEAHHEVMIPRGQIHAKPTDLVGPVCETGDVLAVGRTLPIVDEGDLMLIQSAGAYAAVMGSTYNTRALPAEVLVRGDRVDLVRARQDLDALIGLDLVPGDLHLD